MRAEVFHRVIDVHFQDFPGTLALPVDVKRIAVESFTVAGVAGYFHIG